MRERTQVEAYEEFKRIFANQPELLELARPGSLPASVVGTVRHGTTAIQIKDGLQAKFPDAKVEAQRFCPR